jgi:SAM-dependent methyltransferase
MKYKCPKCNNELFKKDNELYCNIHGGYKIKNDIPIFIKLDSLEKKYFQYHWELVFEEEYPKSKLKQAEYFFTPIKKEFSKKLQILDAGCGDGVHINILEKQSNFEIFGMDLSYKALLKAQKINKKSVYICGDICKLPFKNEKFDIVYSYGVLAYTPDPKTCFKELVRVLKRGGNIGIWIYPKKNIFLQSLLSFIRFISKYKTVREIMANLIVPMLYFLPTNSKINLSNASWKECKEVVLVNLAPVSIWYPTEKEIINLFKTNNIKIIHNDKKEKIMIWGIKQ